MAHEPESLIVATDTGDRIHYLDWGVPTSSNAVLPPLLLIHGLGATAWSWAPVARRLSGHTHVLATDLRGHGLSDSPRSGYDLESLAFDALTVLAANGYGADWSTFPNKITIFRLPLEEDFPDPEDLADEVRRTVLHELGHHAGLDHTRLRSAGYD